MPRSSNVRPVIGVRVKLAARGAGRWRVSAGYRSKFGLTLTEVLEAFEYLKQRGMADCLQLVHFHLGSQITNIRSIKNALTEAARVYVELHRVGAGVQVTSTSAAAWASTTTARRPTSSRRSTTRCRNTPTTSSSASRASATRPACPIRPSFPNRAGPWSPITACWSSTCWASPTSTATQVPPEVPADAPQQISDLFAIHRDLNKKNLLEGYHDAVQAMDEALNLFNLGNLTHRDAGPGRTALLGGRQQDCCKMVRELDYAPEELQGWNRCCRTPISATSRSSSRCPIAGRSSSSSRSCRSIA